MENEMEQPESEGMKNLREAYEREKQAREAAESRIREYAFKDAGFDPTSGAGKALAKLYDGDPDPDAIRTFAAEEFGWEPQMGEHPPQAAMNEMAAQQAAGQQRIANVQQGSTPRDTVPDPMREADKRLAEGDIKSSIALKAQQFTSR